MNVVTLADADVYRLLDERYNPPSVHSKEDEDAFQAEIRTLYRRLIEVLSPYGQEGDYYGISDFAVGPDLRNRATTIAPPAAHTRTFTITILKEKFFRSEYLITLRSFTQNEGKAYRIHVDQDFNTDWDFYLFLTCELAQLRFSNVKETSRIRAILTAL